MIALKNKLLAILKQIVMLSSDIFNFRDNVNDVKKLKLFKSGAKRVTIML